MAVWAVSAFSPEIGPQSTCAREFQATATAYRLSEVPQDIRGNFDTLEKLWGSKIADSDAPLLQTDAPGPAERDHATVRFAQALLVRDKWFVQFEVRLSSGVLTVAYSRDSEGRLRLSPPLFSGPACASIRAALDGVRAFRDSELRPK